LCLLFSTTWWVEELSYDVIEPLEKVQRADITVYNIYEYFTK